MRFTNPLIYLFGRFFWICPFFHLLCSTTRSMTPKVTRWLMDSEEQTAVGNHGKPWEKMIKTQQITHQANYTPHWKKTLQTGFGYADIQHLLLVDERCAGTSKCEHTNSIYYTIQILNSCLPPLPTSGKSELKGECILGHSALGKESIPHSYHGKVCWGSLDEISEFQHLDGAKHHPKD